MCRLRTKFFLFSLLCSACAADYKQLKPVAFQQDCFERLRPAAIDKSWFHAHVDIVGKHFSGLLLLKVMDDSSRRVVFTNESGVKFFDLEFLQNGEFKVAYVMPQLDKRAVVNFLRDDFALLLGLPFYENTIISLSSGSETFFQSIVNGKHFYVVTDSACQTLHRLEAGSKRKRLFEIQTHGDRSDPDSVRIQHHNFSMTMNLKRIIGT